MNGNPFHQDATGFSLSVRPTGNESEQGLLTSCQTLCFPFFLFLSHSFMREKAMGNETLYWDGIMVIQPSLHFSQMLFGSFLWLPYGPFHSFPLPLPPPPHQHRQRGQSKVSPQENKKMGPQCVYVWLTSSLVTFNDCWSNTEKKM